MKCDSAFFGVFGCVINQIKKYLSKKCFVAFDQRVQLTLNIQVKLVSVFVNNELGFMVEVLDERAEVNHARLELNSRHISGIIDQAGYHVEHVAGAVEDYSTFLANIATGGLK